MDSINYSYKNTIGTLSVSRYFNKVAQGCIILMF